MSEAVETLPKVEKLEKDVEDKGEPDSGSEDSTCSPQCEEENGETPKAVEDMEEEKSRTDDEGSEPTKTPDEDDGEDADGPSGSKGSFRGLDYTVKQIPVASPVEASSSSACRKRRRRTKVAKTYYCAHCDFNSPRWDRLKEHLIVHLEDRPFACELCDFKTKTAKKLKRHQTVHSQERKYECSLCKLTFKRAHTLKEHVLTHSKEKLFFCSVCDYSTHRSQYLKRHMMKHTNESLECHLCPFKTVYATLLRRHLQIHSGEKIYKCQFCDYSSVYLHCVSQHRRTHETHILYECGVCDFTTTHHSSLRTHMYIHSKGDKKFKCNFCAYASIRRCDVKRHQLKMHKGLVGLEEQIIERRQDGCKDTEEEVMTNFVDVNSDIIEGEMADGSERNSNVESRNEDTKDAIWDGEGTEYIHERDDKSDLNNLRAVMSEKVRVDYENMTYDGETDEYEDFKEEGTEENDFRVEKGMVISDCVKDEPGDTQKADS